MQTFQLLYQTVTEVGCILPSESAVLLPSGSFSNRSWGECLFFQNLRAQETTVESCLNSGMIINFLMNVLSDSRLPRDLSALESIFGTGSKRFYVGDLQLWLLYCIMISNGIYTGDILLPLNAKWNIDSYNRKGGFKSHHGLSLDHGYMSKWVMGAVSALDILALLLDGFGNRWLNVTPKERARARPRTMWDGRQQGVHMARRFSLLVLIGLLSEWVQFLVQDRLDV